jgi:hypothetical protein
MRYGWLFALSLILVCAALPTTVFGSPSGWQLVEDDDGIKVWSLEIPDKDLPGFRGITMVNATIDELLAELLDFKSHPEWMWNTLESRLVKRLSDTRAIIYNLVNAPWPVKDRDMVMESDYRFTPDHKALTIRFQQSKDGDVPIPWRVVRVPRIEGFYRFWSESPTRTNVLYQVEVDIGGNVPNFSARRYARKLPYETLEALRERVEKRHRANMGGREFAPAPVEPAPAPAPAVPEVGPAAGESVPAAAVAPENSADAAMGADAAVAVEPPAQPK